MIAAISIAQRVAKEYRGSDNIHTCAAVGYSVGGKSSSKGERIEFMTEQQVITKAKLPSFWQEISVLMIDEAHERNLNTDIVLGLAL